jgi:hypothetical protein
MRCPATLQADRWQWLVAAPTMQYHRQAEECAETASGPHTVPWQLGKRIIGKRPPMSPDQSREQLLIIARVARQIRVLQDIRPVSVILVMGQQQADLVQAGSSFEDVA